MYFPLDNNARSRANYQDMYLRYSVRMHYVSNEVHTAQSKCREVEMLFRQAMGLPPPEHKAAIRFYEKGQPFYELTNFYQRGMHIEGEYWRTVEHF